MELFVILAAGQAPDVMTWNKALAEARAPVVIEQSVDLAKHTGFLPVVVGGRQTGFEFLLESFPELATHYPAVARLKVQEPIVYSLGYGSDFNECAAVFYSASVLVDRFGGTALEPQAGVVLSTKDLLSAAKQCQAMAGEPIARVSVLSSGRLLLDGKPTTLVDLDKSFAALRKSRGVVWYYREGSGTTETPVVARQVLDLALNHSLPISTSTKADFSDEVGTDGRSNPRESR